MAGPKREARLCTKVPAIRVFAYGDCKDVDARDKPGHDELLAYGYDYQYR
jgi:hypothetical protein